MKKPVVLIALFSLLFLIIAACSLPGLQNSGSNPDVLSSAAFSTAQMQQTQDAYSTLAAQATGLALGTPMPTLDPGLITETAQPGQSGTSTTLPSLTPYPSLTPLPSLTSIPIHYPTSTPPATLTPLPTYCNQAAFIADISAPDGTKFWPGETFNKVWRLKNIGTCTWNSNYAVVFAGGDQLDGPDATNLGVTINPGDFVDIILNMKAPSTHATYVGYWKMRTSNGTWFGLGTSAGAFTANIQVVSAPTFHGSIGLNLVSNFCAATWSSPSSNSLYCPGVPNFTSNIMYRSLTPRLQNNSVDNEPALVTVPSNGSAGTIAGKYPAYKVQAGDHFTATIGCLYGSTKCNVRFRLDYGIGSESVKTVTGASWNVIYTDAIQAVDVDLTPLAGQNVNFILKVLNNTSNSSDAQAYWLVPMIKHGMPPGTQAMTLKKTANPTSYSALGTSITYSYQITNSGNVNLAGPFNISDDKLGNITCFAASPLTPGISVTCTTTHPITQADLDAGSIQNTAYVTFGSVKSNTEVVTVTAVKTSALTLEKTASPVTYEAVGDVINYSYGVKNTGNVTLAGPFIVADDKVNPVACPVGALAPGAAVTCTGSYTVKQSDLDRGSIKNTASVAFGVVKSADVPLTVHAVQKPALTLKKSATPNSFSLAGDTIHYSYLVTNSGNVTLAGPFTVVDNKVAPVDCPPGTLTLAPEASVTCTGAYTVVQDDVDGGSISNTATASAGSLKSNPDTLRVNKN